MNVATVKIAVAIEGARRAVQSGMLWEDEVGELWEVRPGDVWLDIADTVNREELGTLAPALPDPTHWQFYDLALTALYLSGEVETAYGHETTGSDGRRRAPVRLVKGEDVT
jgi:hypothetical protein